MTSSPPQPRPLNPLLQNPRQPRITFIVLLILLGLALLLWLPFKFNVGFSGDEWYLYFQSSYTAVWGQPSRPLLALPNLAAYALSPGSFTGFNVMLALTVFLRGALTYMLLRQFKIAYWIAFLIAALAMLIPADLGTFYLGALQVYYSSVFYLLALILLLHYWKTRRLIVLLLMFNAQMLSLGMYEAAYPLIAVSPILLLVSRPRFDRCFVRTAILWYLIPALNIVRYIVLLQNHPDAFGYQSSLFSPDIGGILSGTWGILWQHFFDGWRAVRFAFAPEYLPYALVTGIVVFGIALWLSRRQHDALTLNLSNRTLILIAFTGLVVLILSVAIFLPTTARADHVRTYYTSVIGAALIIVALLLLLVRQPVIVAGFIAALCALGTMRLLEQGTIYNQRSEAQQTILLNTLAFAPRVDSWTGLVFLDETPQQIVLTTFQSHWTMQTPFLLTYDDPTLAVASCPVPPGQVISSENCDFGAAELHIGADGVEEWTRPYDELVIFRYTLDGELKLESGLPDHPTYAPLERIVLDVPPSSIPIRMFADR